MLPTKRRMFNHSRFYFRIRCSLWLLYGGVLKVRTKKLSTKGIALMGILMGLQLIFTRFLAIETPIVRVSFTFIATVMMAMIFGPLLTGVCSTLSDFIGIMLFPKTAPYFPGFSLSAFITGIIYGVFFYKKEMTLKRVIIANLIVNILVDICMNTLWLYMIMGPAAIAQFPVRLIKICILFPIRVAIMFALGNQGLLKQQVIRFQP